MKRFTLLRSIIVSPFLSRRRSALAAALLLFSAAVLVSASSVQAQTTYTIQPSLYPDYYVPYQDTVTGTITLPSADPYQTYTTSWPADCIANLVMIGPSGHAYTTSYGFVNLSFSGAVTFTPGSVTLSPDSDLGFYWEGGAPYMYMEWFFGLGSIKGVACDDPPGLIPGSDPDIYITNFYDASALEIATTTPVPGPATVPEPSALIIWSLLGGLGITIGRRCGRKAA